jgi:5'-nucleotidase
MKFKLGRRLVRVVFITVVLFIVLVYVPGIITNDKELLGSTDFYKNSVTEKSMNASAVSATTADNSTSLTSKNNNKTTFIKFLHLNDLHSYIYPQKFSFIIDNKKITTKVGGISALVSKVKSIKNTKPFLDENFYNSFDPAVDTFVLSAGDQISGYFPNYNEYLGKLDAIVHKNLQTDFYILGNHEFDKGVVGLDMLNKFMLKIAPNTTLASSLNTVFLNDEVMTRNYKSSLNNDLKKQLFETQNLKVLSNGQVLEFYSFVDDFFVLKHDPKSTTSIESKAFLEKVNARMKEAKEKGHINVIILHAGFELEQKLVGSLKYVDVAIGAHSHTLCGDFKNLGVDTICNYPLTLKNASNKNVCYATAFEHGKLIGELNVEYKNGEVVACSGNSKFPVHVTESVFDESQESAFDFMYQVINTGKYNIELAKNDEEFDEEISKYTQEIKSKYNTNLITNTEPLCSNRIPNIMCDIKLKINPHDSEVCQVFQRALLDITKADFALINAGAFRHDLEVGDVDLEKFRTMYPFDGKLYFLKLKGSDIKSLLSSYLNMLYQDIDKYDGIFPCGYGLSMDFSVNGSKDTLNNSNSKQNTQVLLDNIVIRAREKSDVDANEYKFNVLEDNREYVLHINDYLLNMIKNVNKDIDKFIIKEYPSVFELYDQYFKQHKVLPIYDEVNSFVRKFQSKNK